MQVLKVPTCVLALVEKRSLGQEHQSRFSLEPGLKILGPRPDPSAGYGHLQSRSFSPGWLIQPGLKFMRIESARCGHLQFQLVIPTGAKDSSIHRVRRPPPPFFPARQVKVHPHSFQAQVHPHSFPSICQDWRRPIYPRLATSSFHPPFSIQLISLQVQLISYFQCQLGVR